MRTVLKLLALVAMGLSVTTACSKSHTPQPGLIGQWKLDYVASVNPAWTIDYAGGVVLELRADSTYTQKFPWGSSKSGTYSTAVFGSGSAAVSFIYLKAAGDSTISESQMQLNDLKLTLTGKYAIEYYFKL
jgi:hypothetical protein